MTTTSTLLFSNFGNADHCLSSNSIFLNSNSKFLNASPFPQHPAAYNLAKDA